VIRKRQFNCLPLASAHSVIDRQYLTGGEFDAGQVKHRVNDFTDFRHPPQRLAWALPKVFVGA
jgi:hypothetical protein